MPIANIHVLKGHSSARLTQLLREVSSTLAQILEAPTERLQVWITEVDPTLYAVAGEPAEQRLQQQPRAEVEIPLIRMVLMEGRPAEVHHQLISELSALTARVLGGDPGRVRVHIALATPDNWGIGGKPASLVRAAELAARKNGAERAAG